MLIKIPKKPKPVKTMTASQEAVLDRKMETHFRSQRELKNGRNFRWDTMRFNEDQAYRANFDRIKWQGRPPAHGI